MVRFNIFVCLIFILGLNSHGFSQCSITPNPMSCSGGNGSLSSGQNINNGNKYWFGGSATYSNVYLNGGDLVVCGNLTLSDIGFNSGRIFVEAGGVLTINRSGDLYMNGSSSIINRGTINIGCNVILQNSNNYIFNEANGVINSSDRLELNSTTSFFVNKGVANFETVLVQSNTTGNAVCLGVSSLLVTSNIINNSPNSFNAPNGPACVQYSNNAQLGANLSNTSDVHVCQGVGATTTGAYSFGSATVFSNCISCSVALPVDFIEIDAIIENEMVKVFWKTSSERNNDYFIVESSENMVDWEDVAYVDGAGNTTGEIQYEVMDTNPIMGSSYYRIKQIDFNGNKNYSNIIHKELYGADDFNLYPNPVTNNVRITATSNGSYTLFIYDLMGQIIVKKELFGINNNLNIADLPKGNYLVKIKNSTSIRTKPLVKL